MTPFDSTAVSSDECAKTKDANVAVTPDRGVENKSGKSAPAPPRPAPLPPDEQLPAPWRGLPPGEPNTMFFIHGPKAAAFDAPPPANPEPPEPVEEIGETLTERQLLFCERYVERAVAARAAREAGYAEATAAKQASRLLKHPKIVRRIIELRRKRHLELAFRRETLLDKYEVVFADAIERREFYAAIQALNMQARLARIDEAMPGFRVFRRFENGREHALWDALTRLEQKLSEIQVGDFPGAAAAVPATPFVEEAGKAQGRDSPEERAAHAVEQARRPRKR